MKRYLNDHPLMSGYSCLFIHKGKEVWGRTTGVFVDNGYVGTEVTAMIDGEETIVSRMSRNTYEEDKAVWDRIFREQAEHQKAL